MKSLKTLRAKDNNSSDNISIGKITITKEFVKKIMVLLVDQLYACNYKKYEYILQLEENELYDYLRQVIPAKKYEFVEYLYYADWDNFSLNEKCKRLFETTEEEKKLLADLRVNGKIF